jgi:hypothetical protein
MLAKGQALYAANAMPPQPAMPAPGSALPPSARAASPESAAHPVGSVRIQLGAFRSQAAAERAWTALTGKVRGIDDTDHVIIRAGNVYRLMARLPGEGAARDFRGRLRAAGWDYLTRENRKA